MKILHIIPTYLPSVHSRGVIDSMHFLNKELVRSGIEVHVYTTDQDGSGGVLDVPAEKEVDIDGVKVFYFKSSFLKRWYFSFGLTRWLATNTKAFDLIHITSVFLAESTLGAYYAKRFNKPYIITPHGSFMARPMSRNSIKKIFYIKLVEKRNLASAAAIHFLADTEKDDYIQAGLPVKKAVLIPNGLDGGAINNLPDKGYFREKFNINPSLKIILFLARINYIKGLDTLIPAFADIVKKNKSAVLVLAGNDDSGYKKTVEELVQKNSLSASVLFVGQLTGKDKLGALQDSDIFVMSSYSEACSMALIEAMHFGLSPVITENVGFAKEIGLAGAGIVIKKEKEELAYAILELLGGETNRLLIGAKAKEFAKKRFSIEGVASEFVKAYNSIINGR